MPKRISDGYTLAELAKLAGARLRGDGSCRVRAVASPDLAGPDEIAFVADASHLSGLSSCRAGALILAETQLAHWSGNALLTPDQRLVFARVAARLHPSPAITPGRHPSAVIDPSAVVPESCEIGAQAVVGARARLGEGVLIGPGSIVAADVSIGNGTRILARAVVCEGGVIGRNVIIQPGAVIGSDGFGYASDNGRWVKIPQLGRVVIEDDVEIGANTTVDRGALGDTVIARGVKLDNLIQIAHNVRVGEDSAMAAQVGVAGSARIGARCTIGGQAGILGHLELADDVQVTATSLVTHTLREAGAYSSSLKAERVAEWRRNVVRLGKLDEMAKRLNLLERNHLEKRDQRKVDKNGDEDLG